MSPFVLFINTAQEFDILRLGAILFLFWNTKSERNQCVDNVHATSCPITQEHKTHDNQNRILFTTPYSQLISIVWHPRSNSIYSETHPLGWMVSWYNIPSQHKPILGPTFQSSSKKTLKWYRKLRHQSFSHRKLCCRILPPCPKEIARLAKRPSLRLAATAPPPSPQLHPKRMFGSLPFPRYEFTL